VKAQRSKVPARWREYYNDLLRLPALVNAWRWQIQLRLFGLCRAELVLVNLGCGKDYHPGYINVDINLAYRRDMWLDLRNPLPFPTGSVDGIFCSHVLEHFPLDEAMHIVRECRRSLKLNGVFRVAVPDTEPAIRAYLEEDRSYFHGRGHSLGRLLSDHVLDNSNHRLLFDFSFMEELLTEGGFGTVKRCSFRQGTWPLSQKMAELDNREDITLFVEACW